MADHLRPGLLLSSSRLAALLVALASAAAVACPVCGQGKEGTGPALLTMTIIMSALPLAMVGGLAAWAAHRVRKARREDEAQGRPPAIAPQP